MTEPTVLSQPYSAFEPYTDLPAAIPICVTQDDVEIISSRLSGADGPGGTDAVELSNWLLRFSAESEAFRSKMAAWANWIATSTLRGQTTVP